MESGSASAGYRVRQVQDRGARTTGISGADLDACVFASMYSGRRDGAADAQSNGAEPDPCKCNEYQRAQDSGNDEKLDNTEESTGYSGRECGEHREPSGAGEHVYFPVGTATDANTWLSMVAEVAPAS